MNIIDLENPHDTSRATRLRTATRVAHERLDKRVMAGAPFVSRERYGLFVMMQFQFHSDIDALFQRPALVKLLPDLRARRRLHLIERDLGDLGIGPAVVGSTYAVGGDDNIDVPTALGWLYVAEGSNLGAAFLLKEAVRLGLSESFGARHLAAAPEGRGLYWKTFTAALDAVELAQSEEECAIAGARAAFARVHELVDAFLTLIPSDSVVTGSQSGVEQTA